MVPSPPQDQSFPIPSPPLTFQIHMKRYRSPIPYLSIRPGSYVHPPCLIPIPSHPIPPLHNFTASLANFQNPTHTHTHVLYTQENKTAQDTPPQARTPSRLQNARQEYMWNNLIRADTYLWKHSFSLDWYIGKKGRVSGHPSIHPSKQVICTHARQTPRLPPF